MRLHSDINVRTTILRGLFLTGGIFIPLAGLIANILSPEFYDPIILRLIIGIPALAVVFLSFRYQPVKTNFDRIFWLFVLAIIPWICFLLYSNSLQPVYSLLLFVAFMAISLGFDDTHHLRIYIAGTTLLVVATVLAVESPVMPKNIMLALYFPTIFITYFVISYFIRIGKQLQVSNNDFRALLDSTEESIFFINRDLTINKFNVKGADGASHLIGRSPKEGDNMLAYIFDEEKKHFIASFNKALKGETTIVEKHLFNEKKYSRWYEIKHIPVKSEGGEVQGVLFTGLEITKRKTALQSLEKSEMRFRNVFQESPIGMALISSEGKILSVNESFCRTTGFEESELSGTQFSDISPAEEAKTTLEEFQKILDFEIDQYRRETRYRHKDGNEINVLEQVSGISEDREIKFCIAQVVEIEQIKKTEDLLRDKNLELEKTNRELDKFVYSAAHDLRAPLTSVLGLIELAKMKPGEEELYKYLGLIEKSVVKLDDFIQEVIDYSRNSRLSIMAEKIDFEELIARIFDNHNYLSGASDITKKININENGGFFSDKGRVEIILNNIISNAIKYHVPNRKDSFISINIENKPHSSQLEISDNGQGIGEANLDKIFNIFYRGNESSTGSGLGLYIVKETVEKLNGVIDVKSELGVGTTFLINLPNSKDGAEN